MRHLHHFIFAGLATLLSIINADAQGNNNSNPAHGFQQRIAGTFEERKEKAIANLKHFTKQDTARVNALTMIFTEATFLKQKQEVSPYREEALALSRKLNYSDGLAQCYSSTGGFYKSASDYEHALVYYDSTLMILGPPDTEKRRELYARTYQQKGMIYHSQENYYMALDHFFESLRHTDSTDIERYSRMYDFITDIYVILNNLEKAEEYAEKNMNLVDRDPYNFTHASVYFSYINVCFAKNDLLKAATYIDKMTSQIPDPKEVQINFGYYMKKGKLSSLQQKYDSALLYYQQAHKYALIGGHRNSISTALGCLAGTTLRLGNNEAAKDYAIQNLSYAEGTNAKTIRVDALLNLSTYYNKAGNSKKAYELLEQAMLIKDSLLSETNVRQINTLTAIYESDKQQQQITKLQNDTKIQAATVKQTATLNKVFIASIIVLLILGYLGYMNFKKGQQLAKQQQALQKQKIIELEKDKQLLTIDAMLKGQEEERSRIAKELHDGLGSMLSGTKLSFMNVKENLLLSPEQSMLFEKSLSMLDNTIGDLRKIAQNLMPEALVKFGLHEALRDFCDSIQSSSGVKVLYQQVGEKRKLGNTAEVFIYRIIQELVNNATRHADANQIMVQLSMSQNKTGIAVEDDGKGFDKRNLIQTKGAGMANINYRVKYFNGVSDIVTAPGSGTSVNIELMA